MDLTSSDDPNLSEKYRAPINAGKIAATASLLKKSGARIESRVVGTSMGESIPEGSTIAISCRVVTEPEVGAIIAAIPTGAPFLTHRIVSVGRGRGKRHNLTRGDASWLCDAPIATEDILGVVTHVEREGTWAPVSPQPCMAPSFLARLAQSSLQLTLAVDVRLACVLARAWSVSASLAGGVRRIFIDKTP